MLQRYGLSRLQNPATWASVSSVFIASARSRHLGSSKVLCSEDTKIFVPPEKLTIRYVRSPGPGGQNVNKLNTKVDVRFNVKAAVWLPDGVKEKLLKQEKSKINNDGELVVQSARYRSQLKNTEDAIEKLQALVDHASYVPKGPSIEKQQHVQNLIKRANERRLREKKFLSKKKKGRGMSEW